MNYFHFGWKFKMCLCCHKDILLCSRRSQRKKGMKREYIKFRCSVYEKKLIGKRASRAGVSLSEYCRNSAMGNSLVERLTPEQLEVYQMLVVYKNNFVRISNMFRKQNPKLSIEVMELADAIQQHLYNFRK